MRDRGLIVLLNRNCNHVLFYPFVSFQRERGREGWAVEGVLNTGSKLQLFG